MKTIMKEYGSTKQLEISDDNMDNGNFITLCISDSKEEAHYLEIDVNVDELLRAIKSYEKKEI